MDRTALAEAVLRDAVQRSRTQRASPFAPGGAGTASIGQCGLGEKPLAAPDPADTVRDLLAQLWPDGIRKEHAARLREVCDQWIREQDEIDRKRNHFLKDFRKRHGFARASYSPAELATYDAGLASINAEEDSARRRAAELLLADDSALSREWRNW